MIEFLTIFRQLVAYVFLLTGVYFLVSTAVGMIRFPNLYTRLHAASKCLMAGSISVLIGCIVLEGSLFVSLKLILLLLFLVITNPIAVHVITSHSTTFNVLPKTIAKHEFDE